MNKPIERRRTRNGYRWTSTRTKACPAWTSVAGSCFSWTSRRSGAARCGPRQWGTSSRRPCTHRASTASSAPCPTPRSSPRSSTARSAVPWTLRKSAWCGDERARVIVFVEENCRVNTPLSPRIFSEWNFSYCVHSFSKLYFLRDRVENIIY